MERDYYKPPWRLEDIQRLCLEHIDEIAEENLFWTMHDGEVISKMRVRYIVDKDRLGYADMGDFFFLDDYMYVLTNDEAMKDFHNEDVCVIFDEKYGMPLNRSEKYICRVIFAGVRTPYKDELGDWVYTGDIVHIKWLHYEDLGEYAKGKHRAKLKDTRKQQECDARHIFAGIDVKGYVDAMRNCRQDVEHGEPPVYAIVLDNHCAPLSHSTMIDRIGTVFWD